ncbi:unnamed protein product, partial [Polarella glacialis]
MDAVEEGAEEDVEDKESEEEPCDGEVRETWEKTERVREEEAEGEKKREERKEREEDPNRSERRSESASESSERGAPFSVEEGDAPDAPRRQGSASSTEGREAEEAQCREAIAVEGQEEEAPSGVPKECWEQELTHGAPSGHGFQRAFTIEQLKEHDASASHSEQLSQAMAFLAAAGRALIHVSCDTGNGGGGFQEGRSSPSGMFFGWTSGGGDPSATLEALRRSLEEDLALCAAGSVQPRLQALLEQHQRALQDETEAEAQCDRERPEIMELRRSVADMERRLRRQSSQMRGRGLCTPSAGAEASRAFPAAEDGVAPDDNNNNPSAEFLAVSVELLPAGEVPPVPELSPTTTTTSTSTMTNNNNNNNNNSRRSSRGSKGYESQSSKGVESQRQNQRLVAVQQALDRRSAAAHEARNQLLDEAEALDQALVSSAAGMYASVMEGRRLEDEQEEAAQEVARACRALSLMTSVTTAVAKQNGGFRESLAEKVRLEQQAAARVPAAPWRLAPGGSAQATAAGDILDPDAYQKSREKARQQSDDYLEQTKEECSADLQKLKQRCSAEEREQQEELARMASRLASLREHLKERRVGVEAALAEQAAERERCLAE